MQKPDHGSSAGSGTAGRQDGQPDILQPNDILVLNHTPINIISDYFTKIEKSSIVILFQGETEPGVHGYFYGTVRLCSKSIKA
jgi:hypothetical protein